MENQFVLLLDVETANDTTDSLIYDIGGQMIDLQGNIYHQFSFVIRDIFVRERELMKSCYYAEKIPEYVRDLQSGKRKMIDFMNARNYILRLMKTFECTTVAAYNCSFDRNALNTTLRFLTKSRYRYFFPYNFNFICVWNMACQSVCQIPEYAAFAEENGFISNHGRNYRATAETVYAFITKNPNFNEEHKGLDDVKIECEILKYCLSLNVEFTHGIGIRRWCWQDVKRNR